MSMPRSFFLVLGVQFLSTVADNAFLIVAIGRIMEVAGAAWLIPLLKISFTLSYVVLAPFVGPLADGFRKGRVMLAANVLKTIAVLLLLAGVEPALCIGLAGLGAAVYAPAKYGLITELLPAPDLVRANGYFEGVTVCAVLLGTALGGLFVSPWMPDLVLPGWLTGIDNDSTTLLGGMAGILVLNAAASVLSTRVADSGRRYARQPVHPLALVRCFYRENSTLWSDALGGLSMGVTTLLWGVAATLQLLVLRWAHEALNLPLDQAAYLQGITAVGVISGALLASRWVALRHARSVLPLGVVLGLLLPLMLVVKSVLAAAVLMVLVGALAGLFLVPMNALLQHRGVQLLTAGRSVAVQGFNENAGVLAMLSVYTLFTAWQVPLTTLILCFGAFVTIGMAIFLKMSKKHHQSVISAD